MSQYANPGIKPAPLVTPQDAEDQGNYPGSTLKLQSAQGKISAVKTGRRIKVRTKESEALAVPIQSPASEDTETAIKRLVAAAPPLSHEQRERLMLLIGGAL